MTKLFRTAENFVLLKRQQLSLHGCFHGTKNKHDDGESLKNILPTTQIRTHLNA